MSKKLENEDIDAEINNLVGNEYIRIGDYLGYRKPFKIRHSKCDNIYDVTWDKFYSNGSRCNFCHIEKRTISNNFIDEKLTKNFKNKFIRIGNYIDKNTKIAFKSVNCNHLFYSTWGIFLKNKECLKCREILNRECSVTPLQKDAIDNLVKEGYSLIGNYSGGYKNLFSVSHNICGYIFNTNVKNIRKGVRCGKCSGRKKKTNQEIQDLIHDISGGEYIKISEYKNSQTTICIKHKKCGHEFNARVRDFKNGSRCPECFGSKKYTDEEIDKMISDLVGKEYVRVGKYINRKTKISLKHIKCGNEYMVDWGNFKKGRRCPLCNESKGEKRIFDILKREGVKNIAQKRIDGCRYKNPLPFDFYAIKDDIKLLIEYDGAQHFRPVEFFGGETAFKETQIRDEIKNKFAKDNNIPMLRITYWDYDKIEEILIEKLKELSMI